MAKCSRYVLAIEFASHPCFVESHRQGDDVMALVKPRAVTAEQQVQ
jgi:hypothetical protein